MTGDVHITTVVPLSSAAKNRIRLLGVRLLSRHRFRSAQLHVYVKNANNHIGCTVNLFTERGRYHADVQDWNVFRAVSHAIAALDVQVEKHYGRIYA